MAAPDMILCRLYCFFDRPASFQSMPRRDDGVWSIFFGSTLTVDLTSHDRMAGVHANSIKHDVQHGLVFWRFGKQCRRCYPELFRFSDYPFAYGHYPAASQEPLAILG